MKQELKKRIERINSLIKKLKERLGQEDEVIAFIIYGSFSDSSDHQPTLYSDVDLEIVVKDEQYQEYLNNFKSWFEANFETVLIETSVSHLQKIFVTNDLVDLQFHISRFSDFDKLDKRELNYFPSGYSVYFDKSSQLNSKIKASLKPFEARKPQEEFDKLNNAFWYFILGTVPYIVRSEYWFAAAGYWAWLYVILCKLLRFYYKKEVEYNPMKHIEGALPKEVIEKIKPLRNLETKEDLMAKMQILIDVYSEYARKISKEHDLTYIEDVEKKVKQRTTLLLNSQQS
jgi:predicted nucleotidyltransferase